MNIERAYRRSAKAAGIFGLALAFLFITCQDALAQCLNNNTLTGTAVTVACPGTVTVPCVQGGQYALVNVSMGNIYTFSTCTSTAFDTEISVYNNGGGPNLAYNDDGCGVQSSVTWTSTLTGQVRVLVDAFPCSSNTICIPLTVSCAAPPPPLTNDNPCQAIALTVTNNCTPGTYSNAGGTLTTTPVIPPPGCSSLVAGSADVWFSFVAPPSGIAIIEAGAGTMTDGAMALYTATPNCSGTYNLVQCNDDGGPGFMPLLSFNNLTPGQTYFIRFWGYGTATGSFTLCVHGPTTVPATNCSYLLEVFDSFGDGWGGSYVSVFINGSPAGVYSCNNAYNAFLIGVNIGQVLVLQYTAVGPFEFDNLFTLSFQSTGQSVYNSGTPPSTGIVYTTTVTCNPPPATPEDCVGGATLCNSLGINNNTNSTGSVADLNPSNYGCLLAAEQQGTWYNFSISSGGTLGMTIDPSGNDDYDWAIWGPYPPGSTTTSICPPLGTPVRCSFASGLDSFIATGSYNTGTGTPTAAWASPQFAPPLPALSDPVGGDGWTPGLNVSIGQVYILYISNYSLSGQSFALNWQLGAGASLDCTVLPMELIHLEASWEGEKVLVSWITATEQNTDYFIVERSTDGRLFEAVGALPAQGNSQQTISYQLVDPDPSAGTSYYRLIQTDLDGTISVSHVVELRNTSAGRSELPFPNPAQDELWVPLTAGHSIDRIALYDLQGHELRSTVVLRSDRIKRVDLRDLPDGPYMVVTLASDGTCHRSPVVKH
jgi:hypothetical protein